MKTIRVNDGNLKIVAFNHLMATYGKSNSGKFIIELKLFDFYFPIYKGKTKPIIKDLVFISVAYYPFYVVFMTIFYVLIFMKIHFDYLLDIAIGNYIEKYLKLYVVCNTIVILTLIFILIFNL